VVAGSNPVTPTISEACNFLIASLADFFKKSATPMEIFDKTTIML